MTPVARSQAAFGVLLRLFPPDFREAYGQETARVFGDDCDATLVQAGPRGLLRLWIHTLPDILNAAAFEHLSCWLADDHPGARRGAAQQVVMCVGLLLGVVATFAVDEHTPAEVPMAVLYGCL